MIDTAFPRTELINKKIKAHPILAGSMRFFV